MRSFTVDVEVISSAKVTNFLDEAFYSSYCSFSLSLVSLLLLLDLFGLLLSDIVGFLKVLGDVNAAIFGHYALHLHLAAAVFGAQKLLILANILDRAR